MSPEVKEVNGKLFPWMKIEKYFARSYSELVESEGFVDHATGIAYEEDKMLILSDKKWRATDVETGLLIATDRSFEDLYNQVESMAAEIESQKSTHDYETWKRQYSMILNGELGSIITMIQ